MKIARERWLICGLFAYASLTTVSDCRAQTADFSEIWLLEEQHSLSGIDYVNGVPISLKIALDLLGRMKKGDPLDQGWDVTWFF